ncbi:zincin-like metallopeptidase domain-containing protein [uncultured Tenacibaculum sp.]|uniref:zincin-like metallopeptidase domain-containing protein n=1 Tax=uncultured Tenacibaculum sp. TaxID=174713 RepID=UPI00260B787D|nr:zincin-like metallopeptidase domain-containing protein [uncultured Tenacibaculum sp.]
MPIDFLAGIDYIETDNNLSTGLNAPYLSPNAIYKKITDIIIKSVKSSKGKWKQEWDTNTLNHPVFLRPTSYATKKPYRGVNVIVLKMGNPIAVFKNPYFLTKDQIHDKKGKLKAKAEPHLVVYFTSLYKFEPERKDKHLTTYNKNEMLEHLKNNGHDTSHFDYLVKTIPILKDYIVYNGNDIEGIDFKLDQLTAIEKARLGYIPPKKKRREDQRNPIAELVIKNFPKNSARIKHGADGAYYSPKTDIVSMPDYKDFHTSESYYSTLFHEMIHSTGHKKRLNRDLKNKFGSIEYAKEELIAEFGAVFLSAQAGILWKTQKNHASYLKNWLLTLQFMGEDNTLLMRAASQAQKAVDYLLQVNEQREPKFYDSFKRDKEQEFTVEVEKIKHKKRSVPTAQLINSLPINVAEQLAVPETKKNIKVPGERTDKNSAAFLKEQRKHKIVKRYDISDKDLSTFLGKLEIKPKESLVATIAGKQGSGKTRFAFRFIDSLAQRYKVAHITMEEHKDSDLYWEKADLYYKGKNTLHNTNIYSMDNIAELDKIINEHDVIVIDSFAKLKELDNKLEIDTHLRKKYDGKLFLIVFQQTTDGKMRGGSKSAFDGDCIFYVEKSPDFKKHYVYTDKNRYQNRNLEELQYNIYTGKLNPMISNSITETFNLQEVEF